MTPHRQGIENRGTQGPIHPDNLPQSQTAPLCLAQRSFHSGSGSGTRQKEPYTGAVVPAETGTDFEVRKGRFRLDISKILL